MGDSDERFRNAQAFKEEVRRALTRQAA